MESDRLEKLKAWEAEGVNAYPYSYARTHYSEEIRQDYDSLEGKEVSVAGRLMTKRSFGKLAFASLQDPRGRIQLMAHGIPDEEMKRFERLDAGDLMGAKGVVTKTKKGEVSVEVKSFTLLAKSLHELPEKFHGLSDTELRYRKRYLDLIMNPESRENFVTRSRMITAMRKFFDSRGYLEVETPVLQPTYGGAVAKPFKTRHNALKADLYLRIADELYLKRLIIGGFEKVYEFGKDFRNEDVDSSHNPEFTQVEFYSAFEDYEDFMRLTEELFSSLAKELKGKESFEYQGRELSFKAPFERVKLVEAIKKESGVDVLSWKSDEDSLKAAEEKGLKVSQPTRSHVVDALFDKFVQPKLWKPAFVTDYPIYMCPLTKVKRGDERLAERFELFVAGMECGNCYSELTNPLVQRQMLEEQAAERENGNEEAQPMDEDFLEAIENGMPPTAGMGLGVARLAMIFSNQTSIKEVILFPTVKPK